MYETILFDIDGTLLDSEKNLLTAFRCALYDVLHTAYCLAELEKIIGLPDTKAAAVFTKDPEKQARIVKLWTSYVKNSPAAPPLFDQVTPTLLELKKRHTKIGIVTSKTLEHMQHDFNKHQINHLFDVIITSDQVRHPKPHPEPLALALQKTGSKQASTLYVGDTYTDLLCAKNCRVPFALAAWGAKEDPRLAEADYRLQQFQDLLTLEDACKGCF
ncbi:MAG: HAD family hydrolase [Eubacterium sp.]|nr:HAD family hydrolase [Eubacterium sp.]